jgi:hypothetical protein
MFTLLEVSFLVQLADFFGRTGFGDSEDTQAIGGQQHSIEVLAIVLAIGSRKGFS